MLQTRVSTEWIRFVRQITALGTIGVSWTIIAEIYGMNFVNMPVLSWQYGHLYAIVLLVITGGGA